MTINPTDTPADDSQMFAPVPSWERGKKRRSFGRRVAAEPRTFAPAATTVAATTLDDTGPLMGSPIERSVDRVDEVDPADASFAAAPVYATRTRAKSSNAPVAITAGLILIGGIAAAGWYYSQPHGQTGVAELTPGASTTTTTTQAAAPAATPAADAPSQMAQNTPPPVVAKTTTTSRSAPATRRAAPARSRAASDTGSDASTTVRAQPAPAPMPMPTPGVAPPAAAATPAAPLVLNIPPAATAPQTVTPQAAPQAAPQTAAPPPTEVPQA